MPQRKSASRFGHACPEGLLIAKSAEARKAGTTQHSPKQLSQSARSLHGELRRALAETERLAGQGPDALLEMDVAGHRQQVNALLLATSDLVRAAVADGADYRGADLIGADLAGADLAGASLRGAYLIGADLRGADLRMADLIGADLRGADICGADLTGAIFVIQSQLEAAKGDSGTRVPALLTHPAHW